MNKRRAKLPNVFSLLFFEAEMEKSIFRHILRALMAWQNTEIETSISSWMDTVSILVNYVWNQRIFIIFFGILRFSKRSCDHFCLIITLVEGESKYYGHDAVTKLRQFSACPFRTSSIYDELKELCKLLHFRVQWIRFRMGHNPVTFFKSKDSIQIRKWRFFG